MVTLIWSLCIGTLSARFTVHRELQSHAHVSTFDRICRINIKWFGLTWKVSVAISHPVGGSAAAAAAAVRHPTIKSALSQQSSLPARPLAVRSPSKECYDGRVSEERTQAPGARTARTRPRAWVPDSDQ